MAEQIAGYYVAHDKEEPISVFSKLIFSSYTQVQILFSLHFLMKYSLYSIFFPHQALQRFTGHMFKVILVDSKLEP